MRAIIKLENFTVKDLKKFISKASTEHYYRADIARNNTHLVRLLSELKPKHTFAFVKILDSHYPDLCMHYLMESRYKFTRENALFLYRISYFIHLSCCSVGEDSLLFNPVRSLVMNELLFNNNSHYDQSENLIKHLDTLKESLNAIEKIPFIKESQKNSLYNTIVKNSFEEYFKLLSNKNKNTALAGIESY